MGIDINDLPEGHILRKKVEQAGTADNLKNLKRKLRGKKRTDHEHKLQVEAMKIFALVWPKLNGRLFAIPNGGARDEVTGGKLKAEGVLAGVWDLFLAIPVGEYGGCWIETKVGDNDLTDTQVAFREDLEGDYQFFIYRDIPQFIKGIKQYLNH